MDIGLQEVYSPPEGIEAVANICFVHGLFGGPWKSFSAKRHRPDAESSVQTVDSLSTNEGLRDAKKLFWPRELLPLSVKNVRIFTFGYDADVGKFMGAAGLNSLYQHARNLLNATTDLVEQTPKPLPVIFVAHSLGGLLVKQALNQSATSTDSRRKRALGYTRGIIFLGTPHHGSNAATYGRVAFRFFRTIAFQSANIKLLTALEMNSESLDQLSTEFSETLEKTNALRMWSFSEEKQVRFGFVGMQIVPPDSARIRHIKEDWGSISGDHRQIAKYAGIRDDGFVKVSNVLRGWVRDISRDPQRDFSLSEEYKECLKTLNDADARLRVQGVYQVSQTNPNSFEWLFTDKVPFAKWLHDDTYQFGPLFWITGRPGSGKSTMMRFALENQQTVDLLPKSMGDPVAYFFHLRGKSKVQKSLKGMLKELLYQVLHQFPHFYAQIRPIYTKRVKILSSRDWDLDSLTEGFLQIPQLTSRPEMPRDRVFLFIDALDENENQEENERMVKLIKRLSSDYESMAKNTRLPLLKICLASRPWTLFMKELGGNRRIPSLAIHAYTTNDIRSYATDLLLEPMQSPALPVEYQSDSQQLVDQILGRANGVFVWVRVVVDSLRRHIIDGTPVEVLRKEVLKYPQELKDLYEYTVKRIPEGYWKELEMALKVLYSSHTALSLTELYAITHLCIHDKLPSNFEASQQTSAWLTSRSGGLIEEIFTWPTPGKNSHQRQLRRSYSVQFIHQTVQDFVRAGIRGLPKTGDQEPRFRIPPGHRLIAYACLNLPTPHRCLTRIFSKIFLYFRECERDLDADPGAKDTYSLTKWNLSDLITRFSIYLAEYTSHHRTENRRHDFLRLFMEVADRASTVRIIAELHGKSLSHDEVSNDSTMNGQRQAAVPVSPKSIGKISADAFSVLNEGQPLALRPSKVCDSPISETKPVRARLRRAIRAIMALNHCNKQLFYMTILISQNLYHLEAYGFPERKDPDWDQLITLAAVGPRLAHDRTDRPRMLKRILSLSNTDGPVEIMPRPRMPSPTILDVKPAPEVIWKTWASPLTIFATALPSEEITDTMLREMAKIILEHPSARFRDTNIIMSTPLYPSPSLLEYCAIFKGQQSRAWLRLLTPYASSIWQPSMFQRTLHLKMGLSHEDEVPDMQQGLVSPGVAAAALRGLSLRYLYESLQEPGERHQRPSIMPC